MNVCPEYEAEETKACCSVTCTDGLTGGFPRAEKNFEPHHLPLIQQRASTHSDGHHVCGIWLELVSAAQEANQNYHQFQCRARPWSVPRGHRSITPEQEEEEEA